MASKLRVDEIVNSTDNGAPSIPNAIKWQKKTLGSSVSAAGIVLSFSGLTTGKHYRLITNVSAGLTTGVRSFFQWQLRENGVILVDGEWKEENVGGLELENTRQSGTAIFKATGTSCDLYCASIGSASLDTRTNLYIEELPFHADETTDFT